MAWSKSLGANAQLVYERVRHAVLVRVGWAGAVWAGMILVSAGWLTVGLLIVVPVALLLHAAMAAMVRWSGCRRPVLVVVSVLAACHAFVAGMLCLVLLKEVYKPLGYFERVQERVMIWVLLGVAVGAIVAEWRLASAAYDLPGVVARADREGAA